MPSSPRPHVFISYSRGDAPLAAAVQADLQAAGFAVFRDNAIRPGDYWDQALERALEGAFAVVTLWTPAASASEWVRIESRYAQSRRRLCPALCADCTIPLEFSSIQYADLRTRAAGDATHGEWARLVDALSQLAAEPTPTDPRAVAFLLGLKLVNGINCPRDDRIGRYWIEQAAKGGHPDAREWLRASPTGK
jgi:TPR repeat protein